MPTYRTALFSIYKLRITLDWKICFWKEKERILSRHFNFFGGSVTSDYFNNIKFTSFTNIQNENSIVCIINSRRRIQGSNYIQRKSIISCRWSWVFHRWYFSLLFSGGDIVVVVVVVVIKAVNLTNIDFQYFGLLFGCNSKSTSEDLLGGR